MEPKATGKKDGKVVPIEKEEEQPVDREVIKDAKNRLDMLNQRRQTAVNSLQQAIAMAKQAEQNSFVLRGRISVYDEEIDEIKKKFNLKDPVQ